MTNHDLENAAKILAMVQKLTEREGDSVCFVNDNPDFDAGPNCVVFVREEFEDQRRYGGATVFECLQKALGARQ